MRFLEGLSNQLVLNNLTYNAMNEYQKHTGSKKEA